MLPEVQRLIRLRILIILSVNWRAEDLVPCLLGTAHVDVSHQMLAIVDSKLPDTRLRPEQTQGMKKVLTASGMMNPAERVGPRDSGGPEGETLRAIPFETRRCLAMSPFIHDIAPGDKGNAILS